MKKIIIMTHGRLAEGIKDCVNVVTGMGEMIQTLSLNRDDNLDDFDEKFVEIIKDSQEGALVFVDMVGGSPYNVALKHLEEFDYYSVITGVNVNMVLEIIGALASEEVPSLTRTATQTGKEAIMEFGAILPQEESSPASQSSDPKKESGSSEITLARVDHRLLHGQVVTKWSKIAQADSIIIVDDTLYEDEYMIEVYRSSAPSGVEVIVAPTEVIGYASTHGTLPAGKIMLLFRDLDNVKRAVEEGLDLKKLQLGGIPNDGNKKMIFQAVNLSKEDMDILRSLADQGISVSAQVVPEEPGISMKEIERKFN